MGASGSIISGNEIEQELNDVLANDVIQFQDKCREAGMNDSDMHKFFVSKVWQSFPPSRVVSDDIMCQADEILKNHYDELNDPANKDALLKQINFFFSNHIEARPRLASSTEHLCVTCNICFESADLLATHEQHSEIHFKKLKKMPEVDKRKLSLITQNVVDTFMKLSNTSKKLNPTTEDESGSAEELTVDMMVKRQENSLVADSGNGHSKMAMKWKSSMKKVVIQNMTKHYAARVSELFYSPMDIKLMSSVTKLYVVNPTTHFTYDIRLYLHFELQCIEVVAHYIKNAPNPRAAFTTVEDRHDVRGTMRRTFRNSICNSFGGTGNKSLRHNDPVIEDDMPSNLHDMCETVPVDRICLDYNVLLSTVMGKSRATQIASDFHSCVENDTGVEQSRETAQYRVHVGCQLLDPTAGGPRSFNKENRRTVDDAIISFVHSHLHPNKRNSAQQKFHEKMTRKASRGSADKRSDLFKPSLEEFALVFNGLSTGVNPVITAPLGLGEVLCAKKDTMMQLWEESWIDL